MGAPVVFTLFALATLVLQGVAPQMDGAWRTLTGFYVTFALGAVLLEFLVALRPARAVPGAREKEQEPAGRDG
ncbi:hypothetical protein DY926_04125 [Komagataeibacter melaceti]|uniref:Uncharacterized protein n=1 Tax=Komagataeibacter melaceti TaxID=2766577 RepID=A0A371Z2R6_9PROT|nr:hypothetical protein [Komagataeibacter melaceti]RFD20757.1 hypothetical protein DY926_04125 [Komagataeibacter melaceti]